MELAKDQIAKLYSTLREKRLFTLAEINQFLVQNKVEFSKEAWIQLLSSMVELEPFLWLPVVDEKMKDIASDDPRFIEFLDKLATNTKSDMGIGAITNTIKSISYENPKLGVSIYKPLHDSKNSALIVLSGFFLTGMVREDIKGALRLMSSELDKEDAPHRIAFIEALVYGFKDTPKKESAREVFDFLRRASKDLPETYPTVAGAYFELFNFEPNECKTRIIELMNIDDPRPKLSIVRLLSFMTLPNFEFEWQLIEKLAQSHDAGLLDGLAYAMANRAAQRPTATLEIIRAWIENDDYYKVGNIEWLLERLGKAEPTPILDVFESWIGRNDRLNFHIPKLASAVLRKNASLLVERLKGWLTKDHTFRIISLQTFDELLSDLYREKGDNSIVDSCLAILSHTAQESGIDMARVFSGEEDKLFQCLLLIEELEIERSALDYEEILRNLGLFPALKGFLGVKWFESARKEDNRTHDLLKLLASCKVNTAELGGLLASMKEVAGGLQKWALAEQVRSYLYPFVFLTHLDTMLSFIKPYEKGTSDFRDGLKNQDQFWQTVSEIELVGRLRSRSITVEIKPRINGNSLDFKITIGSDVVLVEVINPEMWRTLRLVSGAHATPNRARRKFFEEFEQHLKECHNLSTPILIMADVGRSEMDESNIRDYLEGTLQFTWVVDKTSGKIVQTYLSRRDDSMGRTKSELNVISGGIAYKRYVGNDGHMNLEGKLIENPNAFNKLDPTISKKIFDSLFT